MHPSVVYGTLCSEDPLPMIPFAPGESYYGLPFFLISGKLWSLYVDQGCFPLIALNQLE